MCAPSPPPPPDYVGAAQAQGAANREAALQGGLISNPNISNPYGSRNITWSQGEGDLAGYWYPTISDTLTPTGQARLDRQENIQNILMGFAQAGLGRVADEMQLTPSQIAANLQSGGFNLRNAPTGSPINLNAPTGGPINFNAPAGGAGVQRGIDTSGLPGIPGAPTAGGNPTVGSVGQGPIQGSLDPTRLGISGNVDTRTIPGFRPSDIAGLPGVMDPSEATRRQIASSILSRMEPGFQQREDQTRSDLVARGFREGTRGYQDAFDAIGRDRNDAAISADIAGGQEMDRIFREQLARRSQLAGEQFTAEQNATAARMGESAATLGRAGYGLQAQGQEFGQGLQAGQFANQAQAQDFGQRMQNATLANLVNNQQFTQNLASANYSAAARNQLMSELMATGQFTNTAQAQDFLQQLQAMQAGNAAQGQDFLQQLQAMQAGNAAQGQQFSQAMQGNTFANQSRQQAIQEALLARNLPLNELNALRTGNQVTIPQFQNFQGQNVAPAPIFAANQALSDYNTDVYNANMGGRNSMLSGLFGLGSAAIPFLL